MSRNLFHRKLDVIFRIQYDISEWQEDVVIQENVAQSPLVVCMNKAIRWPTRKYKLGGPALLQVYCRDFLQDALLSAHDRKILRQGRIRSGNFQGSGLRQFHDIQHERRQGSLYL